MRSALRTLVADSWVVGIASAIAVGYAVVVFVRSVARLLVDAIAGGGATGPLTAFGVGYRDVVASGASVLVVATLAALAFLFAERSTK